MCSDVFCRVYHEFGWNYDPEAFGQQLLRCADALLDDGSHGTTWLVIARKPTRKDTVYGN